jgi:hydroxyacylglutathione hydrolase
MAPTLRHLPIARIGVILVLALVACGPGRTPSSELAPGERLVIDVREPRAFAAGHHEGALNVQVGWSQLESRLPSYVPDRTTPLAVYAADEQELAAALQVLESLGYRDVSTASPPEDPRTLELWSVEELRSELAGPDPPVVLDVRGPLEFLLRPGEIPGEVRIDQDRAPLEVEDLDRGGRYAVICEIGWRSSQLASWMRRRGFEHVVHVIDGQAAWRRLEDASR